MFARFLSRTIPPRLKTASAVGVCICLLAASLCSQSTATPPTTPSSPQSSSQPAAANPPQTAPQPQQPASPSQPQTLPQPGQTPAQQVPGAGDTVQNPSDNSQPQPGAAQDNEQPEAESHISKQQAKELFRSVDEILGFVSGDTGLPILQKVKRNLITREQVERYVDKRMKDDKDEQRLEQARLVLQKFGLLPKGYDLHAEFLKLMAEQVAAYYDPKTRSVNLLDWLPADSQKPVLAHELTHALQDQQVGLTKWELAGAKNDAPLPDNQEYIVEEAQSARQCVTEGQAQVVWFDYTLAPANKDILTAPEYVDAVRAAMGDSKDSPVFAQAPIFLKESLMMPYTFGLDFVRTILANKGKEAAFAGLLHDPPIDTRQIMQPETYLLHQQVAPLTVPDFDRMFAPAYTRFDFGGMGEFDVYLLAKQYGVADPPNYYRHWRGGYYYAAQAKNAPKDQIAMLYFSRWDSPQAARDFAKMYADYLPKRYPGEKAVAQGISSSCLQSSKPTQVSSCNAVNGSTSDGPYHIELHDNDLLIMEGYDESATAKARDVLLFGMSPPASPKEAKTR